MTWTELLFELMPLFPREAVRKQNVQSDLEELLGTPPFTAGAFPLPCISAKVLAECKHFFTSYTCIVCTRWARCAFFIRLLQKVTAQWICVLHNDPLRPTLVPESIISHNLSSISASRTMMCDTFFSWKNKQAFVNGLFDLQLEHVAFWEENII